MNILGGDGAAVGAVGGCRYILCDIVLTLVLIT